MEHIQITNDYSKLIIFQTAAFIVVFSSVSL